MKRTFVVLGVAAVMAAIVALALGAKPTQAQAVTDTFNDQIPLATAAPPTDAPLRHPPLLRHALDRVGGVS